MVYFGAPGHLVRTQVWIEPRVKEGHLWSTVSIQASIFTFCFPTFLSFEDWDKKLPYNSQDPAPNTFRKCLESDTYKPSTMINVIGRIIALQGVCSLIPRICKHVMFYGNRELWLQMELKLLISWPPNAEIILDYPGGHHVITRVLQSGRLKGKYCPLECPKGTQPCQHWDLSHWNLCWTSELTDNQYVFFKLV